MLQTKKIQCEMVIFLQRYHSLSQKAYSYINKRIIFVLFDVNPGSAVFKDQNYRFHFQVSFKMQVGTSPWSDAPILEIGSLKTDLVNWS